MPRWRAIAWRTGLGLVVAGLVAFALWLLLVDPGEPVWRPAAQELDEVAPAPAAPPPAPAPHAPPPAKGPRPPGGPCTRDADCAGPEARCLAALPGGYCVRPGCDAEADDCPSGSVCVALASGHRLCVEGPCERDEDCSRHEEGLRCNSRRICWTAQYLPTYLGRTPVGGPCDGRRDCESGLCLPDRYAAAAEGETSEFIGGYCSAPCDEAVPGTCPAGSACRGGHCLKACATDADCRRASYSCQAGVCRPLPGYPESVPLGRACRDDGDCGDGTCLAGERGRGRLPGGYCSTSEPCDRDVEGSCGRDGVCVRSYLRSEPFCAKACARDEECRTADGYACDPDERACVPPPVDPSAVPLGAPCDADADCGKGQCLRGARFPGGYCAAPGCTPGPGDPAGPDACALAGGLCVALPDSRVDYCMRACARPAECRLRDGYTCHEDAVCWYPRIRVTR